MTKRTKTSFLGEVVFLAVLAIIVFIFLNTYNGNQVKKIEFINNEYGISEVNLIPDNKMNYIAQLKELQLDTYTAPIISYMYLEEDAVKLERSIKYSSLNEDDCLDNFTVAKISSFKNKRREVLDQFNKVNNNNTEGIYWDTYKLALENKNLDLLFNELSKKEICN